MFRTIQIQLETWKNQARRKPLILKGARQVGKTWSVRNLGNDHFDDIISVDFEKNPG